MPLPVVRASSNQEIHELINECYTQKMRFSKFLEKPSKNDLNYEESLA